MADEKKNKGGRPFGTFKRTPEQVKQSIEEYKEYLKTSGKPPTMAGLAYYTQIERQTLYNYKQKDGYFDIIKEFRDWVMMNYEELAIDKGNGGIIFLMKNYGYTDRQETEISGNVGIKISGSVKDWAK